jgi:hypothetical protein
MAALAKRIEKVEAAISLAVPPEQPIILRWGRENSSEYWMSEVTAAMSHLPPGRPIAIVDGDPVGFACCAATARGFFGPAGIAEGPRGKGKDLALLFHTLQALKARGYANATVGSAGPHELNAGAVRAEPIEADKEDVRAGLLRVRHDPRLRQ